MTKPRIYRIHPGLWALTVPASDGIFDRNPYYTDTHAQAVAILNDYLYWLPVIA